MRKYLSPVAVVSLAIALAFFASAILTWRLSAVPLGASSTESAPFSVSPRSRNLDAGLNLFDAVLEDQAPAPQQAPTAPAGAGKLMLTGVLENGPRSAAILRDLAADSSAVFFLGARVFGSGEYLSRVTSHYVILAGVAGGRRRLDLGVHPDQQPQLVEAAAPRRDGGIDLSRSEIRGSARVPEQLLGQSKIIPEIRGNRIVGFKVTEVADNTIMKKMGIQQNDVVRSVNGQALDSIERSTQIWEEMKKATEIHMLVERNGADQTLSFYIRP